VTLLTLFACSSSDLDTLGVRGDPSQLALTASDFVLQSRNGVDAQTFSTYNAAPASNSIGLWDSTFSLSAVNPNQYRILASIGSDGFVDAVRPYGTTGAVTIPTGGYVVQAADTFLPWLSNLAVDDELLVKAASSCAPRTTGVPVLMYHSIGADPAALDAHLQAIDDAGYHTITLAEFRGFLDGSIGSYEANPDPCDDTPRLPQNPILLTFDDGYADQFPTAPALLDDYGMTGVFFVITSYPGTTSAWATWSAISDAVTNYPDAVEIACHSHAAHYQIGGKGAYLSWTDKAVLADMATCRDNIESHTGVKTTALAWPFGNHDDRLTGLAKEAGFDVMMDTWPGINTPENDDPASNVRRFGANVLTQTWAQVETPINHWVVCGDD
jgi:peptidoglycan/xylan/chitin deacetylase (PgdA/CDA1 family)